MITAHSRIGACLGAAALLLSACNQPAVTLKPPASQDSENTVRDWDAVAHTITTRMAAQGLLPALPAPQPSPVPPPPPPRPVFVRVAAPNNAFLREVAGEIEADVLRRGGTVSRRVAGATVVNLAVSFVQWSPRDKPPGLLGTEAAAAVVIGGVLADSGPYSYAGGLTAAAVTAGIVGVASDLAVAATPRSNAEAVWEAEIVTADSVIMRLRAPVYIRSGDIGLYATRADVAPALSWSEGRALLATPVRYQP
jgi:hypothetical protein